MAKLEKKQRRNMISRRIKEIREQKGLNQFDLARALDCTQGIISQYETGQADPPLDVLIQICDALGCSLDYLLGRNACYDLNTQKGRLLKAFEVLKTDTQEMIVLMLESITKGRE